MSQLGAKWKNLRWNKKCKNLPKTEKIPRRNCENFCGKRRKFSRKFASAGNPSFNIVSD